MGDVSLKYCSRFQFFPSNCLSDDSWARSVWTAVSLVSAVESGDFRTSLFAVEIDRTLEVSKVAEKSSN